MEEYEVLLKSATSPDGIETAIPQWNELSDVTSSIFTAALEDNELAASLFIPLRLARNLCSNPKFQDEFLSGDLYSLLLPLLDEFVGSKNPDLVKTARALAQVFANLTVKNPEAQKRVWGDLFPKRFQLCVEHTDEGIAAAATAAMYNCLLSVPVRLEELLQSRLVFTLLQRQINHQEEEKAFHWTMLVVKLMCLHGYLPTLITECDGPPGLMTPKRMGILQIWEKLSNETALEDYHDLESTLTYVCGLLETISQSLLIQQNTSDIPVEVSQEVQSESINCVLQSLVHVTAKCEQNQEILTHLGQTNIIANVVEMIRTLDQTAGVQPPKGYEELPDLEGHYRGQTECILSDEKKDFTENTDFSLKRVLVNILANICFGNCQNQNLIRECGGIEVCLAACRIDENNLYVREYALFAIRNLTYGNQTNIDYIEAFRLQGVETSDQLTQLGLEARMDNGSVNVTNIDNMM